MNNTKLIANKTFINYSREFAFKRKEKGRKEHTKMYIIFGSPKK